LSIMSEISFEAQLDKFKESFLWAAAQGGNTEDCESLIEIGADINWKNSDGDTPLLAACRRGHTETVEALVVHGADVNICGLDSLTPVHICCSKGDYSTLNILLSANPILSMTTKDGKLALDIAEEHGYQDICNRIMHHISTNNEGGAQPNLTRRGPLRILEIPQSNERLRRGANNGNNTMQEGDVLSRNSRPALPSIPSRGDASSRLSRDNGGTNSIASNIQIPVVDNDILEPNTANKRLGVNNFNLKQTNNTINNNSNNNVTSSISNCGGVNNNNTITNSSNNNSYTLLGPNIVPGHDESTIALRKQLDIEQKARKALEAKVSNNNM
jgi:ankyrin repeat protein